jgi:transcriptional regulator with XRE-family HTH domain
LRELILYAKNKRFLVTEYIPINPKVLKWAREVAGFTLGDMLKRYPKYQQWEQGEAQPTYAQLDKLATKLHRPIALFFFPDIPEEEPIEKSLRVVNSEDIKLLTPAVRSLFRKGKVLQLDLKELYADQLGERSKRLEWLSIPEGDYSISELATNIRKLFGISTEEQNNWRNRKEALVKWIEILADNGIFVLKGSFGNNVSGFCVYDEVFPVIFLNNSISKTRQIFSMFRELAHLLSGKSHLDVFDTVFLRPEYGDPDNIEVKCNDFAGEFLLPDNKLTDQILPKVYYIEGIDIICKK